MAKKGPNLKKITKRVFSWPVHFKNCQIGHEMANLATLLPDARS